jgi:hypothetical protein
MLLGTNNIAALPPASMQLVNDDAAGLEIYSFYDSMLQEKCQSDKVKVRQVITEAQFGELSRARIRLYGQRKKYYETLFGAAVGLDEYDFKSYVFAFYYDGEIIGTQRITPHPHEAGKHIERELLKRFVGQNYVHNCVEFSRLIVDKSAPVKGIVDALASTGGSLVALNTGFNKYITYVKPRLTGKFSSFSFDPACIYFQIKERGDHHYALYKGDLLAAVVDFFGLDCHPQDLRDMNALMKYSQAARTAQFALTV